MSLRGLYKTATKTIRCYFSVMRSRVGLEEMEVVGRATVNFYGILGIPLIIQTSPLTITIHRSLIAQ